MSEKIPYADFVVKSKVRTLIKEADMNVSADAFDQIGRAVTKSVKRAIYRAQKNGRKTVRGSDV